MDIRVEDLKPGARLMFGRHSLRNCPDTDGIAWLKLGRGDGKFITESVIDFLMYDAMEPRNPDMDNRLGRGDYWTSNLHQYLNAVEDSDWYRPAHMYDEPPRVNSARYGAMNRSYDDRPGFLSEFEDYEVAVLAADICLPELDKIIGEGANGYDLFRKKGIRAHPTQSVIRQYSGRFQCTYDLRSTTGFVPYWVMNTDSTPGCLTRSGGVYQRFTCNEIIGVRPVCEINPNAIVDVRADGVYVIRPFEATPMETATDDDIMSILGLS